MKTKSFQRKSRNSARALACAGSILGSAAYAQFDLNLNIDFNPGTGIYTYTHSVLNQGPTADLAIVNLNLATTSNLMNLGVPTGFGSFYDAGVGITSFFEDADFATTQTFAPNSTTSPFTFTSTLAPVAIGTDALDANGTTFTGFTLSAAPDSSTVSNAVVTGILSGNFTLTKSTAGHLTLTGANTYTGGTVLNAGTLNINTSSTASLASGPVGLGSLNINGGTIGTTTNTAGATNNTIANAVNLNADFSVSNVVAAVNLVNPQNGGLVTDGVTFSGAVSINQANVTINTLGGYLDFTGVIGQNAPGNGLTFIGNTFTLIGAGTAGDAPNTYTGTTNLQSGAILLNKGAAVAGADGVAIPGNLNISTGAVAQVLSRTLNANVANNQISPTATVTVNGTLDIGGTNQTINTLSGAGTIRLDNSVVNAQWGATFGGPTVLTGAGILTVNNGSFTGTIVDAAAPLGMGQVVKATAGTLNLFGASTYTGGTTLNAGTLGAGNAKAFGSGNLTVNGGTLQTLNGPLIVNIGNGNIALNGGSVVFNVGGVTPGVNHDQIFTGGSVTNIAGNLALVQQGNFQLAPGNKVLLVSAAAGVAGGSATGNAYANVTGLGTFSNTPLLVPTVNLYTNGVVLEAMQGSFAGVNGQAFANAGVNTPIRYTFNQTRVAIGLDSVSKLIGNKTGIYKELDFLSTQPLGTLTNNLDKIAPEELTAIFTGSIALANVHSSNLLRGMENLRDSNTVVSASAMSAAGSGPSYSGGMSAPSGSRSKEIRPPSNDRWGMFMTGSGEWTRVGSTTNAAGYNMETGGVTVGVDYRINTNFAVGLDLGYVGTSTSLVNGGKIATDGGRLGLFGTYFDQNFHVDAAVTGGLNSYKTKRITPNNTVATGRPEGSEINMIIAAGYDWKFGGLTIGPMASYQYTNVQMNGFRETGTFAPLNVRSETAESSRTAFGVRAYYDAKVAGVAIRPELKLAWQHEFGDNGFSITSNFATLGGNAFTVNGATTGRDAMLIGAGVSILWTDRFATYINYDGEVGRTNYDSHSISGGVRLQF